MKLKILNRGYASALEEVLSIYKKLMANKEVEEIFNYYCENVVNSDEAAAILTLAEILRHDNDKEVYAREQKRLEELQGVIVPEVTKE